MEQTPIISFIIPAYNASATLFDCVESIVKSMHGLCYEMVIVDDGSSDNTLQLAESLSEENHNIRVFHQSNKGLSSARNTGIDLANGRFLAFVDSDDYIDYVRINKDSLTDNYDIIALPIVRKMIDGGFVQYGSRTQKIPFGKTFSSGKEYLMGRNVIPCVCAYLWRREFIVSSGLRFTEGIYHEDEEFTVMALLESGQLRCDDFIYRYVYVARIDSITTVQEKTKIEKRLSDFSDIQLRLKSFVYKYPQYRKYAKAKLCWMKIDTIRQLLRYRLGLSFSVEILRRIF